MTDSVECSVESCREPHLARGFCSKHYYRWKRGQDIEGPSRYDTSLWERFVEKVWVLSSGCWLWVGFRDGKGYGKFRAVVDGPFIHRAHRWAYEQLVGPITTGLTVDHVACGNTGCVNPAHMELVTQAENTKRARAKRPRPTHCKRGHPYDESNTRVSAKGHWTCRACDHERYLERKARTTLSA